MLNNLIKVMKIQVDIVNKTIKVEGRIKFTELKKILINNVVNWEDYEIENEPIINWANPIDYIPTTPYFNDSPYKVTFENTSTGTSDKEIFNYQLQN